MDLEECELRAWTGLNKVRREAAGRMKMDNGGSKIVRKFTLQTGQ